MKNTIRNLVSALHQSEEKGLQGGFGSIRGGKESLKPTTNIDCSNAKNCNEATNRGECTNVQICDEATNVHLCTNPGVCFA